MTDSAHDVILKNRLALLPKAIVCVKTPHAHAVNCLVGGTAARTAVVLGLATRARLCSPGPSVLHRAHDCHGFIERCQPYLLWGRDGENFPRVSW